jgi:ceramide glucosyltransferase
MIVLYWLLVALAAVGILGSVGATATLVGRMGSADRGGKPVALPFASLSMLVPLKGADGHTFEHLSALVASDLPIPVEFVFALESADDPAYVACERVRDTYPDKAIRIVLSGPANGRMGKQHNLAAAAREARFGVIGAMDADVGVTPSTLVAGLEHLTAPGTGAVYFLPVYQGPGPAGGGLVALYTNYSFSLNFGALALRRPLPSIIGSLWLLRRTTLDVIGGLDQFTATVSDDAAIGRAIAGQGLRCVLVPMAVRIPFEPLALRVGLRHLAKWIAMLRAEGLGTYLPILLTWHPIFWSAVALLVGLAAAGGAGRLLLPSALLLGAALVARVGGAMLLNRCVYRLPALPLPLLLVPYELLAVPVLFAAGFFRRTIVWRGTRYRLGPHGVIRAASEAA